MSKWISGSGLIEGEIGIRTQEVGDGVCAVGIEERDELACGCHVFAAAIHEEVHVATGGEVSGVVAGLRLEWSVREDVCGSGGRRANSLLRRQLR